MVGRQTNGGNDRRAQGHRTSNRWSRREHVVSLYRRRHSDGARDARCHGAYTCHDHVRQRDVAAKPWWASTCSRTRRSSAGIRERSASDRATDCRRLGRRIHQPHEHPSRQRRGPDKRHHRARQQRSVQEAGRLGRFARMGVGCVARPGLSRDRSGLSMPLASA